MSDINHAPELADILADLPRFTNAIQHLAQRLGLELPLLEVDHIALRCHQNATAERWKQGLLRCATLFSQRRLPGDLSPCLN